MQLRNGEILFSPSDLNAFLECEHLTQLELAVAAGELERPADENPQADLVKRKGDEHEAAYLAALLADGREVVTIANDWDLEVAARATRGRDARRAPTSIYQACFVDGDWRGFADFVERQPDGRYEVVDTKLARHSKPAYVLQLCFYSEQVARIQGSMPERMHVVLGTRERESLRVADFLAYYHRVRDRFVSRGRGGDRRLPAAGLVLRPLRLPAALRGAVARRRPPQPRRADAARPDSAARARRGSRPSPSSRARADEARPPSMPPRTFETLRDQAAMQVAARSERPRLEGARAGARARVRAAAEADAAATSSSTSRATRSGSPAAGSSTCGGSSTRPGAFTPFWAHDRAQERRAVEGVIDLIRERRAADPAMHVYHYAAYEVTALKRLTCEYGTREEELDDLLRGEVFVDLYKVVSQGLRLSHERYGLKQVETFYFERDADLRAGDDSILLYEEWLERHDPAILDDDRGLQRGGLSSRRCGCATGCSPQRPGRGAAARGARAARAAAPTRPRPRSSAPRCSPGCPTTPTTSPRPTGRAGCWRSSCSTTGARRSRSGGRSSTGSGGRREELQERDSDAIGGLEPAGPPIGSGESLVWPFTLPRAAAPPRAGRPGLRPRDRRVRRDDRGARRGGRNALAPARADRSRTCRCRSALIPGGPYKTPEQQAALRRLARSVLAGDERYRARQGRSSCREPFPAPLPQDDLEAAKRARRGARRPPPRDPGAARNRQDLHRRAADRPPDAARPAGRRHRDEPQGDPQPARRGRARRHARRASRSAG